MANTELLESVFQNAGCALLVTDSKQRIIMVNKKAKDLFAKTDRDFLGGDIDKVLSLTCAQSNEQIRTLCQDSFVCGSSDAPSKVFIYRKNDGTKICVSGAATSLDGDSNNNPGTVWAFHDVTKEYEIDKIKTDFITLVSHQLRTPLTGIKWFIEMLKKNLDIWPTEESLSYIDKINDNNNTLIALVNDLLQIDHINNGSILTEISNYSLKTILEQTLDTQDEILRDRDIKIVGLEDIPYDWEVAVDSVLISQVFGNLFNNAAKYSPMGSVVSVKAEKEHGFIKVSIRDSGSGIPKDQQEKIFSKFFRGGNVLKTSSGTGLGLYISKSIVECHGGAIYFESTENFGTTFFVELPLGIPDNSPV